MIKTKISICLIVLSLLCSCAHEKKDYISFVNPLIGTGGHGHVFVGASVPHGMIQLGPNNDATGWDWCSGYHDSDSTILGFAHSHLSGTGIADLGDVLFMPAVGVPMAADSLPTSVYVSTFAKSRQNVRPGYYADLTLVNNDCEPYTITDQWVLSRCGWTPLDGLTVSNKVDMTWVNGRLAYRFGVGFSDVRGLPLSF